MKTQKSILLKQTIMVFAIMITLGACNNKQVDKSNSDEQPSVSESKISAPDVDIFTATFMGDIKAVNQHISAGTDLNAKDQYGSTPLTIAATFGKTEAALALIDGGADLNMKNNEGSTPLHVASFFCREEIVKALLEKGADKTIKNNFGATALESISAPFNDVKVFYEQIGKQLGPLGLKLDLNRIEKTRPVIADMLQQ